MHQYQKKIDRSLTFLIMRGWSGHSHDPLCPRLDLTKLAWRACRLHFFVQIFFLFFFLSDCLSSEIQIVRGGGAVRRASPCCDARACASWPVAAALESLNQPPFARARSHLENPGTCKVLQHNENKITANPLPPPPQALSPFLYVLLRVVQHNLPLLAPRAHPLLLLLVVVLGPLRLLRGRVEQGVLGQH